MVIEMTTAKRPPAMHESMTEELSEKIKVRVHFFKAPNIVSQVDADKLSIALTNFKTYQIVSH